MQTLVFTTLLLFSSALAFNPSSFTNSQILHPRYTVHWNVQGDTIHLALEVATTGWVGFGIGEPTSGSMPGSDIVTGYVKNGVATIHDRHATAFATPAIDSCQDWVLESGSETNGKTILEISRKLKTNDNQDRNITGGLNRVIFAFGEDDEVSYHSGNRGIGGITFYPDANSLSQPKPTESDLMTINLTMNAYPIPATDTMYACSIFKAPVSASNSSLHIVQLDKLVHEATKAHLHHFVIYACLGENEWAANNTNNFVEWCSPFADDHNCKNILWAWAPGISEFNLPPQAGFRMGPGSDEISYLVLEVHYDNPSLISGLVDYSGIAVSYTAQLRPHDAATLILGDSSLSADPIPAGKTSVEYEFSCTTACSSTWSHEINVFADFLHMHKVGSQMWSTIWRNGNYLGELNRVEYYNFGMQQVTPRNLTLKPGDRINTHCVYDTRSKTDPVVFGDSSSMEMCFEFVFYWPKIADNFAFCGYLQTSYITGTNRNFTSCGDGIIMEYNPEIADPSGGINRAFGTLSQVCEVNDEDSSEAFKLSFSIFFLAFAYIFL